MLRALPGLLDSGVPVIGVNFGRVGFLSSMQPDEMETGLTRAFRGDLVIVELPTLRGLQQRELAMSPSTTWSSPRRARPDGRAGVGDRRRGPRQRPLRRDHLLDAVGVDCLQPLERRARARGQGIDAMATTFVAPHRSTRPLVVPRGKAVVVLNRTPDVAAVVLVDGHRVGEAGPGGLVTVRLGAAHTLLALPEATFVSRYRQSFST